MLSFRTILLWLAFFLLILQYFWDYSSNLIIGIIYYMLPTLLLVLWFGISLFSKDKIRIHPDKITPLMLQLLRFLRPLASISIVLGALLKYSHFSEGNFLLAMGLFFMAVYSTILNRIGESTSDKPNDIIDDQDFLNGHH